jgi:probable F420-dependent oxidoreductase
MTFRFGFQCTGVNSEHVGSAARRAEDAGFDIFQVGDHIGTEPSPLVSLADAAAATERIRLGTLVLNNDLRHPVVLAQEVAALDRVSNGRVELGVGAGHSFNEYQALGLTFDPPRIRKERLAEAVEILRSLLDGHPTTFRGRHYTLESAMTLPPQQEHVPILVGVNGRMALTHAARYVDVVAPTMLGRTLSDGLHHEVRWEASRLDKTVSWIRDAASARAGSVSLHALVQAVVVTEDRIRTAEEIAASQRMDLTDVLETPFLCIGTNEEIAEHLLRCRQRWGIEYYTFRCIDEFEPIMRRLRLLDQSVT